MTGFRLSPVFLRTGCARRPTACYWSDLGYKLNQFALFGEGTLSLMPKFEPHRGAALLPLQRRQGADLRRHLRQRQHRHLARVAAGNDRCERRRATRDRDATRSRSGPTSTRRYRKGFRLGGINDPLNVPLCTPQDLVTFGGRETWEDEKVWNYEVGVKSRVLKGNGGFNVAAFYADISDLQATVTAGSCSSRVVFNVPKARSQGVEVEFDVGAEPQLRFRAVGQLHRFRVAVDADVHQSVRRGQQSSRASRKGAGCRLFRRCSWRQRRPTSARCGPARSATSPAPTSTSARGSRRWATTSSAR